jgi:hypothetical protein
MTTDREALVSMLAGAGVWLDRCDEVADLILSSTWLKNRDRTVQAETLRTVADKVDPGTALELDKAAANIEGMNV